MACLDAVFSARQASNAESAVLARYGKERMPNCTDIRTHPGMDVALYRDHDFFFLERLVLRIAFGRLGLIPLCVLARQRMDVVIRIVAVPELDGLTNDDTR